ncbi:hypothetical protein GCM10022243_41420 [Saccharothrix violaceirubra]|uniref:DUF397 domain-containing protein n=1 Tax=Saccharothrix violaceirubra TaxID=413306 RepID=A0A7W7T883_9PSEU|nr:DUF397 domain-containing protein [Saccharothrix violaceirubra]MBB4968398.1 hypothetical protein [Saccharothrix violaceirubra]
MNDLTQREWRKSSYSNGENGQCVELATVGAGLAIRDSTNSDGGEVLVGPRARLAFLAALKVSQQG